MTNPQIQLKTERITKIPLKNYEQDFTFIVNHKEYKTSKLTSQLLSPIICDMNVNDASIDTIEIHTRHEGDFQKFVELINFERISIENENEVSFFNEIFEILGLTFSDFNDYIDGEEINNENIISKTKRHESLISFIQHF